MFHYHNLIHEDDDMMKAFSIIDTQQGLLNQKQHSLLLSLVSQILYIAIENSSIQC